MKRAVGGAIGLGLSSLYLFPLARPALADGYDVYSDSTSGPCGPGGYAENHDCTPGCGPSWVDGDGACNGSCNCNGWHYCCGTVANGYTYFLRPNECWGDYDAWIWECNYNTYYRCHDGWTVDQGSIYFKSICRFDVF